MEATISGGSGGGSWKAAGGVSGTVNTGGGGGGGSDNATTANQAGGAGGSGTIILSIPTNVYSGTYTGSPLITTNGTNTVLRFNAGGSYTA